MPLDIRRAAALAALIVAGCRASAPPPGSDRAANPAPKSAPATPKPRARATPEPSALTIEQAVGQRIVYAYGGHEPPRELREMIRRGHVGGIILFKRNVRSHAHLAKVLREMQAIPRPAALRAPLFVMIDQEGGLVKRLPGLPTRSPGAVGRANSVALARREGLDAGRYLRACGVNVNLAPVVDVARPGTYQERTQRAYGRDPARVARLAAAFAAGLGEAGVVACFKHFPGLGAAPANEDLKINRMLLPRAALDRIDLRPFKSAPPGSIVMTSTGIYPALDSQPALFSSRIVRGVLRREVGFQGLAITDDLEVPALRPLGTPTARARRAILAGNDVLLFCVSLSQGRSALRGLARLYAHKKLDQNELFQTTRRILNFRLNLTRRSL